MGLKELRLAKKLSKKEAADLTGWGTKKIGRLEKGIGKPADLERYQNLLEGNIKPKTAKGTKVSTTLHKDNLQKYWKEDMGGINGKVMGTLEDGTMVMIKKGSEKDCLQEYLSYKLGELLGLNVNKVSLMAEKYDLIEERQTQNTRFYSVHYWIENFKPAHKNGKNREADKTIQYGMRFFDKVIGNRDRHGGNWGFDNEGTLWLIDNGFSGMFDEWNGEFNFKFSGHDFHQKLEYKNMKDIVDRFLKLSAMDFAGLFKNIPVKFAQESFKRGFVNRMTEIQKQLVWKAVA